MARKARIKSTTGIYHVLVRAIADLPLFTDEEDTQIYTNILNDLQHQGRCEVFAYALFPTHVHLLVRDSSLPIQGESEGVVSPSGEMVGSLMKRLASAYSYFFNVKYDHYGPLYQDRFKSNPVESHDYYLRVLHHIANQDTPWKMTTTTIPSILSNPSPSRGGQEGLPSPPRGSKEGAASGLLPSPPRGGQEGALLDFRPRSKRITDSRLLTYLQTNFQFTTIPEFLQREQEEQKAVISNCKKLGGSIRQIVRLTGSPYQAVFQVK